MNVGDRAFAGSIPALYERLLVPLIFEPYAQDLAARVGDRPIANLLEIAAGTGVLTRALADTLAPGTRIVATDLNQAMLDEAARRGGARPVEWRQADAMALPFADGRFDVVACQFGVMFFPDRATAFAGIRRVLAPGGRFLFNTWDAIGANEFADVVTSALVDVFPADPPRFLARTPHGYYQRAQLEADLAAAGFAKPARIETVAARSRAGSARDVAIAYCQGTPLRGEIEAQGAGALDAATEAATRALEQRFGLGPVDGGIQALVVEI